MDAILERILSLVPRDEKGRVKRGAAAEFAQKVGVTNNTLANWKAGTLKSYMNYIPQIAEAYNVSADWLLGKAESKAAEAGELSAEARQVGVLFDQMDEHGKKLVRSVLDIEAERLEVTAPAPEPAKATKVIPLFGAAFAAGHGEPDFGNPWEDYEVDADSRADFAIHVSGDSMEPYLHDGSIALGRKVTPRDGDVAALLVDGEYLVKQVMYDYGHNLLLFSLNRGRSDADRVLYHNVEHTVLCFGTILMERVPLPMDR